MCIVRHVQHISNSSMSQPQTSIQSVEPVITETNNLLSYETNIGQEESVYTTEVRKDDQNPFINPELNAILTRPYPISTFSWNSSSGFGTKLFEFNVASTWINISYPNNVLEKFRYFAADFKVKIQMQSTMMHYGKLAFAWLPNAIPTVPAWDIKDAFALDVNYIDAAQPIELEVDIPFMSPLKWWSVRDFQNDTSMSRGPIFKCFVLAPLGNAQATLTSVPVTFIVSASNVRACAPVPDINQAPYLVSMFQDGNMTTNTKERGFVRTAIDTVPTFVSVRQMAPIGQSLEDDTAVRLSLSAATVSDSTKAMVQALIPDEHNIINVCKRPVLFDMLTINGSTTGEVTSILCHPSYPGSIPNGATVANMQIVSRMAQFWHGSLKYCFAFSCSKVSTMRVSVALDYCLPTSTGTIDDRPAVIWDITGSCVKTIEVPYLSPYPYIPTYNGATELDMAVFYAYGVPTLRMRILNPLTSGNISTVVPDCYVNIFAAVGDDFRLFLPRGLDDKAATDFVQTFSQDNLGEMFSKPFDSLGTKGEDLQLPEYNFGEEFMDIMDILQRYSIQTVTSPLTRQLPTHLANYFRHCRYGLRIKVIGDATTTSAYGQYAYRVVNAGPTQTTYRKPPLDLVPSPISPVGQFELPFYETWYYDLPITRPSTQMVFSSPGTSVVYTALSVDSILSFWTFAAKVVKPADEPIDRKSVV